MNLIPQAQPHVCWWSKKAGCVMRLRKTSLSCSFLFWFSLKLWKLCCQLEYFSLTPSPGACSVLFCFYHGLCFVLFSFNNLFLIMCRNNLRKGRTKLSKHLITKDPWLQMHDKYSVKFCIVCYIYWSFILTDVESFFLVAHPIKNPLAIQETCIQT